MLFDLSHLDFMSSLNLFMLIFMVPAYIFALCIHEYAHAFIAYKLGDSTAKEAGRMTLNPLKHLTWSALLLPLLTLLLGFPLVGAARPVPYNPSRLKHGRRDEALVALAGPLSNALCALIAPAFYFLLIPVFIRIIPDAGIIWVLFFCVEACMRVNLFFALFNLLPIPPLDGSKILLNLSSQSWNLTSYYDRIAPYGILIMYLLVFVGGKESYVLQGLNYLVMTIEGAFLTPYNMLFSLVQPFLF